MRAAVLTISTTIARGDGEDVSGPALVELCEQAGLDTTHEVVPDDREAIAARADAPRRRGRRALRLHHRRHRA